MKFADEEHLRRHTRKEVKAMSVQLHAALGSLEGGNLEDAAERFEDISLAASQCRLDCIDWIEGLNHADKEG